MTTTAPAAAGLFMRTHVGRNILQSAQLFLTVETALWEYVVNSLQYVPPGTAPVVDIVVDKKAKTVTVTDNGTGMSAAGLVNFFTMHGENTERRAGRGGRGKFGTGKSAAFGIGDSLTVDTVHAGLRNVARLTLAGIKAAGDGPVPVEQLVKDGAAPTAPDGTRITIGGISREVNHDAVRRFLSRHLTAFRGTGAQVSLDSIPVTPWAPAVRATHEFTPPPGFLADTLGVLELHVRVAAEPLEPDERGINVTAGSGNLVAREGAGVITKDWGSYLFGEVDCPALEGTDEDQVAAFGVNRDLKLNAEHPVAAALIGFIGYALEQVREGLVADYKKSRQGAEAQRLKATADEIAQILNADFTEQAARLDAITANVRKRTPVPAHAGADEENPDDPTFVVTTVGEPGTQTGTVAEAEDNPDPTEPTPSEPPTGDGTSGGELASPAGEPDPEGAAKVRSAAGAGAAKPRGGLHVDYAHMGAEGETPRSLYDGSRSAVVINLDHPAIAAAAKTDGGVTGVAFKRLSYEVAFTEYALLIAQMEYERNPEIDASDALFEVRHTLLRIAARSEVLYTQ